MDDARHRIEKLIELWSKKEESGRIEAASSRYEQMIYMLVDHRRYCDAEGYDFYELFDKAMQLYHAPKMAGYSTKQ